MKHKLITMALLLTLLAGVCLLLYPVVSDCWNTAHATRAVANYEEDVQKMEEDRYQAMWEEAEAYNRSLAGRDALPAGLTEEEKDRYDRLLDVDGSGMMGYLEVPSIHLTLPVYHGTEEAVIQVAAGHLEWSSLPVGGEGTHCVLSGHRGLPSARLFTNLDQLMEGDRFMLHVLDRVLTYEVDQILTVEPDDLSALAIQDGKDLCTLMTCTPYGVNTHRLLVRGHRVDGQTEEVSVTGDAVQVEPLVVAPLAAIPVLLVLLAILLVPGSVKKHAGGKKNAEK